MVDLSGMISQVAARLILDFAGFVLKERERVGDTHGKAPTKLESGTRGQA